MKRYSVSALLMTLVLGSIYAFGFAGQTSPATGTKPVVTKATSCGCVVCKCPDCDGEACGCESCACVGCGCAE